MEIIIRIREGIQLTKFMQDWVYPLLSLCQSYKNPKIQKLTRIQDTKADTCIQDTKADTYSGYKS